MAEQRKDPQSDAPGPSPGVSGEWRSETARVLELVQVLPEPAVLVAADARVLAATPAACTLLDRDAIGLSGIDSGELFAPDQRELYRACLSRVRAGASSVQRELLASASGKLLPLEVSIGPAHGAPPVFVVSLRRARLPYGDLLAATAYAVQDALLNGESSATIVKRFLERAALSPDCVGAQFWTLSERGAELFRQAPRDAFDDADQAVLVQLESLAYRAATSSTGLCVPARIARPGLPGFAAVGLPIAAGENSGSVVLRLRDGTDAELEPEVARLLEVIGMQLGQGLSCARLCAECERLRSLEHTARRRAEQIAESSHRNARDSLQALGAASHGLSSLLGSLNLNLELLATRPGLDAGSLERQAIDRALRTAAQLRSIVEQLQHVAADGAGQVEPPPSEQDVAVPPAV